MPSWVQGLRAERRPACPRHESNMRTRSGNRFVPTFIPRVCARSRGARARRRARRQSRAHGRYARIEERELRCAQLCMILAGVKPSRLWSSRPDLLHNLILRRGSHDHLDAHNEVARGDQEVGRHLSDFFVLADCQRDKRGAIRHAFASVLSGLGRVAASFLGSFVFPPAKRLLHGSSYLPLRERFVDAHAKAPIGPGEVVFVPWR